MKFTVAALLATLATACFAQRANISYPINGTTVTPGSKQVVQIVQPVSVYITGWFTSKPHWHQLSRTRCRASRRSLLWLGYYRAAPVQAALLPAKHWEPFSITDPSNRNSHRQVMNNPSRISRSLFRRCSRKATHSFLSSMSFWSGWVVWDLAQDG